MFPLIHRGPDYTFWAAPPSLFKRDGSFRGVFPLFARSEHRLFVMPGFYRSRAPGEPERDAFFPLFARWKGADSSGLFLALYLEQESPNTHRKWIMPFWMTTKQSRSDGTQRSWLSVLWPIFEREETRAADGELRGRKRRFLVFTDEVDESGARTLGLLWIPIFERL